MFIKMLFSDPRSFFAILLIISFSISLHELVHTWVALKCGDDTAASNGHLTLNPLKQMGLFSILMLLFIGIAWGQVPVDESKMKKPYHPALVAASGPLTNLVLFVIFTFITAVTAIYVNDAKFAVNMLTYGAVMNLVLAFFNLLPLPGLDGWHIIRTFWKPRAKEPGEFVKGATLLLIMMLFFGMDFIFKAAYFIFKHFIIFILRNFPA